MPLWVADDISMGMASSVRSALREVHATSPKAGEAKIHTSLDGWLGWTGAMCDWQSQSALVYRAWEAKGAIGYNASDTVEVVVRAVLETNAGQIWGRLIMWDTPPLSQQAAHLLASPAVELLDQQFPQQRVAGVEVWQCRTGETYVVATPAARLMRGAVASHVASM